MRRRRCASAHPRQRPCTARRHRRAVGRSACGRNGQVPQRFPRSPRTEIGNPELGAVGQSIELGILPSALDQIICALHAHYRRATACDRQREVAQATEHVGNALHPAAD